MSYNASIPIPPRAMWTVRLPPHPPRVLFYYDSHLKKHIVWTQEFNRIEGTCSTPTAHDATNVISSDPWYDSHKPSASMTRWAFSRPVDRHFTFVTHLTVSNYGDFSMQDIIAMLSSMRQLEDLELCRVDVLESPRLLVPPPGMVRSLKRLSIEACNVTEGLLDACYDLLFRFLSLFARIERLRLVAAQFRPEHLFYDPIFHRSLRLPTIVHLEAEGFFAYVLREFFHQRYPVRELLSLHLSRCFSTWERLYWLTGIVRAVAPTLQHFAFRPNLTANPYDTHSWPGQLLQPPNWPELIRDFAEAVSQCPKLSALEFGLYAHDNQVFPNANAYDIATALFRHVLAALPESRLDHLVFVLDVGEGLSRETVPWAALDALLSHVCIKHSCPLKVRVYYSGEPVGAGLPLARRTDVEFLDPGFWNARLPMMRYRMMVRVFVEAERLSVGQYVAPAKIDQRRVERIETPGLRSLFGQ